MRNARKAMGLAAWMGLLTIGLAWTGTEALAQAPTSSSSWVWVYIGTYTGEKSQGIYRAKLDLSTGTVSTPELAAASPNPSFLATHPTRPLLYAVSEIANFDGQPTGAVSAFAIDGKTGALTALNQQPSGGRGPAHVSVDAKGTTVLVANYGGGSVASLAIEADGRLKPPASVIVHEGSSANPKRQTKPYAHSIKTEPSGQFAYAADLGTDKVFIYRLDPETSQLTPAQPPSASVKPGAGPRHTAISSDGRFLYLINEIDLTLTVFSRNAETGALTEVQTVSTLPAGVAYDPAFSTAEVVLAPSGRFLYGSNRGHDSIAVYAVDPQSGRLTLVEHEPTQGSIPRGFGIDPTGQFLIVGNQRSDSIVVLKIDQKTGALTPTGQTLTLGSPVSFVFVPAN